MCKILIVDDDKHILLTISNLLKNKGYPVEQAVDGFEALDKVKNDTFMFVITDYFMPGMNGLELIREIKKYFQDQNQALPYFIVITGNPDSLLTNECEKYGVLRILNKPFKFGELIEIIEQYR